MNRSYVQLVLIVTAFHLYTQHLSPTAATREKDKALLIKVNSQHLHIFLSFYVNKWHIGALIFNRTAWLRPFHNR